MCDETQECDYWEIIDKYTTNWEKQIQETVELVLSHYIDKKPLQTFTTEELAYFPINYLKKHANSVELLECWSMLSQNHKEELETELPRLEHFNEGEDDFDGILLSRKNCDLCLK